MRIHPILAVGFMAVATLTVPAGAAERDGLQTTEAPTQSEPPSTNSLAGNAHSWHLGDIVLGGYQCLTFVDPQQPHGAELANDENSAVIITAN